MTGVESPHGRHQSDDATTVARRHHRAAYFSDGADQLGAHSRVAVDAGKRKLCSGSGNSPCSTSVMYCFAAAIIWSPRCAYLLTNFGAISSNNPKAS